MSQVSEREPVYAQGPPRLTGDEKKKCERLLTKASRDELKAVHYPIFILAMTQWAGIPREYVTCSFIKKILAKLKVKDNSNGGISVTYNMMVDSRGIFFF